MAEMWVGFRGRSPTHISAIGIWSGTGVGESRHRPPFSSPFSFTDATVASSHCFANPNRTLLIADPGGAASLLRAPRYGGHAGRIRDRGECD